MNAAERGSAVTTKVNILHCKDTEFGVEDTHEPAISVTNHIAAQNAILYLNDLKNPTKPWKHG